MRSLHGAAGCRKKLGTTSRIVEQAASVLVVHHSRMSNGQLLPQAGRRHSLAKAWVKDFPVGIQLLILAQIGSSVFNKGAKFPFKNLAGIWLQCFSHSLPHNCEEYEVWVAFVSGKHKGEWGLFWQKWLQFLILKKLFCILKKDAFNNYPLSATRKSQV